MDSEKKKRVVAMAAMIFGVAIIVASAVAFSSTNASLVAQGYGNDATSSSSQETTDAKNDDTQVDESTNSTSTDTPSTEEKANAENHGSHNFSYGSHNFSSTENYGSHNFSSSNSSSDAGENSSSNSSSNSGSSSADARLNVNVTIDGSGYGNVSYSGSLKLIEGASVYDALKATGLSINARETQYGVYVAAIGGLAEKSAGGESGWKYSVNGAEPSTSCSNYVLRNGDVVKWKFVTKANEAVG